MVDKRFYDYTGEKEKEGRGVCHYEIERIIVVRIVFCGI